MSHWFSNIDIDLHSCDKPHLNMMLLFLLYILGPNLLIFCWEFLGLSLFLGLGLVLSSIFFFIKVVQASQNKLRNIFSSSILWKRLHKIGAISFINVWKISPVKWSQPGDFSFGRFKLQIWFFFFFDNYRSIQVMYFILSDFW